MFLRHAEIRAMLKYINLNALAYTSIISSRKHLVAVSDRNMCPVRWWEMQQGVYFTHIPLPGTLKIATYTLGVGWEGIGLNHV